MIKYIKDILTTITPGQRLFALVFLLIAITLMTVGPKLVDLLTMDNTELEIKVNRQKTEIVELNSRVGELTQQVLENQRSCTDELIEKEREILGIIGSIETEMANNHNSLVRIERNAPRVNRMQKMSNPEDTIRLAYSIIEEPEVITEVRTDNTKSLQSIRKLKNKLSSDIKKKQ